MSQIRTLFKDDSAPVLSDDSVVTFEHIENYLSMKDSIQFQDDRRLDHTLVFQVDEFWSQTDDRLLLDLGPDYLDEITSTELVTLSSTGIRPTVQWRHSTVKDADPHEAYQPLTPLNAADISLSKANYDVLVDEVRQKESQLSTGLEKSHLKLLAIIGPSSGGKKPPSLPRRSCLVSNMRKPTSPGTGSFFWLGSTSRYQQLACHVRVDAEPEKVSQIVHASKEQRIRSERKLVP